MGHVTRDNGRCAIDVDTDTGRILLRQRWAYRWIGNAKLPPWSYAEQRDFHRRVDLAVWAVWSNRAAMAVSGASPFAERFARRALPVNMDVSWVTAGQHWTVFVFKVPPGWFHRSHILWNEKRIELGSRDYEPVVRIVNGRKRLQRTAAHEAGHAFGNTGALRRGDEYPKDRGRPSPHVGDDESIMHVGEALRARHFRTIVEELNQMIPDTRFQLASLS